MFIFAPTINLITQLTTMQKTNNQQGYTGNPTTEQPIDEHRSLEIITRMIADTSAKIDSNSGRYFLLWGYTTVVVSLFEYVAQVSGWSMPLCLWAWWLIPLVGGIGTIILTRSERHGKKLPKSYLDRSVSIVWTVFGLSFGFALIAALVYGTNLLFLTAMLMGMGTVITGKICRHKVLTVAGKAALILSLLFPANHLLVTQCSESIIEAGFISIDALLYAEIVIFAAIFMVMMVIPGHILTNRAKKSR